jgi:hypothetical protein
MAYALTQEDIDRFGIPNAKAGDIANPADRALLGLEPDAATLSLQTPAGAAAPVSQVASTAAPMVNSRQAPMSNNQQALMGLLETPISQDPFENLSRGQRTMIGFAALKDAGRALQGKEGGAVQGVINDITNRADMERKRQMQLGNLQQERQRQAALDAFLTNGAGGAVGAVGGVAGAMSGQTASAGGIDAQIAALQSQSGVYAQMGQLELYSQRMSELLGQRDRLEKQEEILAAEDVADTEKSKNLSGQLTKTKDAVATARQALEAATGLSGDELQKQLDLGTIDPRSFSLTRQSFIPDSKDFKNFQAAASKLGAMLTFSNLDDILKSGVVLGTLSDADFKIISDLTGVIDPVNMPEQTAQTILQAYISLVRKEESLQNEISSGDPFDALTRKYN